MTLIRASSRECANSHEHSIYDHICHNEECTRYDDPTATLLIVISSLMILSISLKKYLSLAYIPFNNMYETSGELAIGLWIFVKVLRYSS